MKKESPAKHRAVLVTLVFIVAAILYGAGVLSGLYASAVIKEETKETLNKTLNSFSSETQSQIQGLQNFVTSLENSVREFELEQDFIDTLSPARRCAALEYSLQSLLGDLNSYRSVLPFRIESYEYNRTLSHEYERAKVEYNRLSLRTWTVAKKVRDECDTELVHGLYFYNRSCQSCINQGEELDTFTQTLVEQNTSVWLFAIDSGSNDSTIALIKTYYNVTQIPAIIVNGFVLQAGNNSVVPAETVLEAAK